MQFQERVALVAGAAGGIGGAIARRLAAGGARVVAVDLDAEGARRIADEIREAGGQAVSVNADLAQTAEGARVVAEALAAFGNVDIAVNSVGQYRIQPFASLGEEDWEQALDTDLKSCYNLFRPIVQHIIERGYGRLLTVSSRTAMGMAEQAFQAASRAGVIGFTKTLALEVGRYGITVNGVSPYYIDTPALRRADAGAVERAAKATALRRAGSPADVAAAAAFLVSEEAGFITGQVLSVCGGSNIGLQHW